MINIQDNMVIKWVNWRIRHNKNAIIVINGGTGSGKTYTALELASAYAKEYDVNFKLNTNLAFQFMNLLKHVRNPVNSKPGTPLIFEEVGASGSGSSSMEWQSIANRFFNSFTQTTRKRQQILIFTCPYFHNLDPRARKLVHMQIIMENINFETRMARTRPYVLQVAQRKDKIYFKRLRFTLEGKTYPLKFQDFPHPPKKLSTDYEVLKDAYMDELDQMMIDSEQERLQKLYKPTNKVIHKENALYLLGQGHSTLEVANKLGISQRTARRYQNELKGQKKDTKTDQNDPYILDSRGFRGQDINNTPF